MPSRASVWQARSHTLRNSGRIWGPSRSSPNSPGLSPVHQLVVDRESNLARRAVRSPAIHVVRLLSIARPASQKLDRAIADLIIGHDKSSPPS